MTQDNGMDTSPSWQELKDRVDRMEAALAKWREAGHLQRVIAGAKAEALEEAADWAQCDADETRLLQAAAEFRRQAKGEAS